MAHNPAIVDMKRGGRRPGPSLVLANYLYYDNTQCTCALHFHALFDYVMTSVSEHF